MASGSSAANNSQQSKCLNEKRRREQENTYIEELAELIADRLCSISSLSVKPDKCAILQEAVKQIRVIKQETRDEDEPVVIAAAAPAAAGHDLQASEVSSTKPSIIANEVLGPLLLEALDGFIFVVDQDGKIEFVSENVNSFITYNQIELIGNSIYNYLAIGDHARFSSNLLPMSAISNSMCWASSAASSSSASTAAAASSSCQAGADSSSSSSAAAGAGVVEVGPGVTTAVNSAVVSKSRTFNARFRVKCPSHRRIASSARSEIRDCSGSSSSSSGTLLLRQRSSSSTSAGNAGDGEDDDEDHEDEDQEDLFDQCVNNGYVGSSSRTITNPAGEVYENMQISTVLLPTTSSSSPHLHHHHNHHNHHRSSSSSSDQSLVCIARRMPLTDRTLTNIQVEQFSTRLDLTGKILSIDTSGVSSTYSQHLNKELIGKPLLELCHIHDLPKLRSHLMETLKSGDCFMTSPVYRLMVAKDRFVCVQTKSKLFPAVSNSSGSQSEYVMAAHSIIRDSESTTGNPAPADAGGNNNNSGGNVPAIGPAPTPSPAPVAATTTSAPVPASSSSQPSSSASCSTTTPVPASSSSTGAKSSGGGDPLPGLAVKSESCVASSSSSAEPVTTSNPLSVDFAAPGSTGEDYDSELLNCLGMDDWDYGGGNEDEVEDCKSISTSILVQVKSESSLSTTTTTPAPPDYKNNSSSSAQAGVSSTSPATASGCSVQQQQAAGRSAASSSTTGSSGQSQSYTGQHVQTHNNTSSSSNAQQSSSAVATSSSSSQSSQSRPQSNPSNHNNSSSSNNQQQSSSAASPNDQPGGSGRSTPAAPSASSQTKLRNLLTQGSASSDGISSQSHNQQSSHHVQHDILRDLLNPQDGENDDDDGDFTANMVFSFDSSSSSATNAASTSMTTMTVFPSSSSSTTSTSVSSAGIKCNSSTTSSGTSNNMLRMLLNDEEAGSANNTSAGNSNNNNSQVVKLSNYGQQQRRASQPDILQQLLKDTGSSNNESASSNSHDHGSHSSYPSTPVSCLPSSLMSPQAGGQQQFSRFVSNKRKSVDDSGSGCGSQPPTPGQQQYGQEYGQVKRQCSVSSAPGTPSVTTTMTSVMAGKQQTQQLAGANPMLASMLAQAPKSIPPVPAALPTSIVSQVPQERLPKNLEQKLVHTPAGQEAAALAAAHHDGEKLSVVMTQQQQQSSQSNPLQSPIPPGLGPVSRARFQMQAQVESSTAAAVAAAASRQQSQAVASAPTSSGIYSTAGQQPQKQVQHSSILMSFDEHSADPDLSDILDQVYGMENEMEGLVVGPQQQQQQLPAPQPVVQSQSQQLHHHQTHHHHHHVVAHQQSVNTVTMFGAGGNSSSVSTSSPQDDMLLKILDEVLEPSNPSVATPSTPTGSCAPPGTPTGISHPNDLNEKLKISEIQRQLMSCETSVIPGSPAVRPSHAQQQQQFCPSAVQSQQHFIGMFPQQQQPPPPAYPSGGMLRRGVQQQVPSQVISHRPTQGQPPPQYVQMTSVPPQFNPAQLVRCGPRGGPKGKQQPQPQQQQQQQSQVNARGMATIAHQMHQHQQLMRQQQHQQIIPVTPDSPHIGVTENLSDLLNNTVAPNVTVQMKGPPGGSSRFPLSNSPHPHSPAGQLSPIQRPLSAPFSPSAVTQHRMSPHAAGPPPPAPQMIPYGNVSSPHGPHSPMAQIQYVQQQQVPQQQQSWSNQPQQRLPGNRIQAANPMLNAQLAGQQQQQQQLQQQQQQQQIRFAGRPGMPVNNTRAGLASPGPMVQQQRNSPVPQGGYPASPIPFQQQQSQPTGPQPGGPNSRLIQLESQKMPLIHPSQQQVQRQASNSGQRVSNSPRILSGGTNTGSESPSFYGPGTPIQLEARSPGQFMQSSSPASSGQGISSEVRQNLSAMVRARSQAQHQQQHQLQQQQQQHQQQQQQSQQKHHHQQQHVSNSMPSTPMSSSGVSLMSSHPLAFGSSSLNQADIDALEFSLGLSEDSAFGSSSMADMSMFELPHDILGNNSSSSSPLTLPSSGISTSTSSLLRSQSVHSPRMMSDEAAGSGDQNSGSQSARILSNDPRNNSKSLLQQLLSDPTS